MEENRYDVTTTTESTEMTEATGGNAELGAAILVTAGAAAGIALWEGGKRLFKWARTKLAKKPAVIPGEVVEGVAVEVEDSEETEE